MHACMHAGLQRTELQKKDTWQPWGNGISTPRSGGGWDQCSSGRAGFFYDLYHKLSLKIKNLSISGYLVVWGTESSPNHGAGITAGATI